MAHKRTTSEEPEQPRTVDDEPQPNDDPEALKVLLDQTREEAKSNLDNWKRAAADLANYRRRQETGREEMATYGKAAILSHILPVLDDFERALHNLPPSLAHLTWTEGVFLIERKLRATLEAEGLQPIEAEGHPFDPRHHEAVLYESSTEVPEGQVIAELQKGYMLNDRVLRPTLVRVSKGAQEGAREATGEIKEKES